MAKMIGDIFATATRVDEIDETHKLSESKSST